jgi:site-specific DNA recombinase
MNPGCAPKWVLPTHLPDQISQDAINSWSPCPIRAEHVEIRVYRHRLHDLIKARSLESFLADPAPESHPGDILKLEVKARLQRVGREMKLVVHNAEDRAAADPGLLRIITRAHDFRERLLQDPSLSVPAIARQERLTIGYLSRLLRLPSLAPDVPAIARQEQLTIGYLSPAASSFAGTRYRHGHHQRQTPA